MSPTVTCARCGFQVEVGLNRGYLSSYSPDQAKMKTQCKKAADPDFAYDCADLTRSLLTTLQGQPHLPAEGLQALRRQPMM